MMDECCIHYETVKETNLLKLSNKDFWSTLLDAAVLCNESSHKGCSTRVTLKCDLDKLRKQTGEPEISTPRPSQFPNLSSPILLKKCIFCNIVNKFLDGGQQQLYSCHTFLADETICKCASLKGDKKFLLLSLTNWQQEKLLIIHDVLESTTFKGRTIWYKKHLMQSNMCCED